MLNLIGARISTSRTYLQPSDKSQIGGSWFTKTRNCLSNEKTSDRSNLALLESFCFDGDMKRNFDVFGITEILFMKRAFSETWSFMTKLIPHHYRGVTPIST